jgi:hypothetical protein
MLLRKLGHKVVIACAKISVEAIRKCGTLLSPLIGDASMSTKEDKLTAAWLRENMSYDPLTGVFAWTKPGMGRTVGRKIGARLWSKGKSYLTMKINGEVYYAHRVAWLYHFGEWPKNFVDHIDEDRTNNSIANLREATAAQNAARRKTTRKIGTSRGVFPHGVGFVARIHFAGKRHYLGYFKTKEAAQESYEAKAKEIHGEFAHVEQVTDFDKATAEAVARSPHRDWLLVATPGFEA